MFTGIIRQVSKIITVRRVTGGLIVAVTKPAGWRVRAGDSIAVNGVCSTAVDVGSSLTFFYMLETLDKTYFAGLRPGQSVNLEQSLRAGDRLDGHMVLGHVDAVGIIKKIKAAGAARAVTVGLDPKFMRLVADKGSVAVEGVSLTVVKTGKNFFTVHLIPYTRDHTNLSEKKVGGPVNVELDVLARYVSNIVKF